MDLQELAKKWKSRQPSGKFLLHRMKRNQWCKTCGCYVTKWHRHWLGADE